MRSKSTSRLVLIGAISASVGFALVFVPAFMDVKRSPLGGRSPLDAPNVETYKSEATGEGVPGTDQFQVRLSYLSTVSQTSGAEALASEARAWLAEPQGSRRSFALEAVLSRLFEIDPDEALALSQNPEIGPGLLQRVFASWAARNPGEALSRLQQIRNPWAEQQLAMAVLQEIGATAINFERVVAAGRSLDIASLEVAYLGRLTEAGSIEESLVRAMSLRSYDAKKVALEEIARTSKNPSGLLSLASSLGDRGLREKFLYDLYKQWSQDDVGTFLQHLRDLDPRDPIYASVLGGGLLFAAELVPDRLLAVSADLSGPLQLRAASAAFEAIAADDPQTALLRWESVQDRAQQFTLLEAVARGFARADLDGAIAWLSTLQTDQADVAASPVLAAVAAKDLARAIDLRLQGVGNGSFTWLDIPMLSDLEDPTVLADKVRRSNDDALLSVLVRRWAAAEPYDAVAWMRSQGDLPVQTVRNVAQQLAERSIHEAFSLGNSLTEERSTWIPAAAAAGAFYDAAETLNALRSFEQEPFYEEALWAAIATVASRQGGAQAAALVGTSPSEETATLIGVRWAEDAPSDAATWALGLPDRGARAAAVLSVAVSWAQQDADTAMTWIASVPDGTLRAEALSRVCSQLPGAGLCD